MDIQGIPLYYQLPKQVRGSPHRSCVLTRDVRGLYLGIQEWVVAEGEYHTHAWLAVFDLLADRGEE